MRHGRKLHKLSRPSEHRKALLNNLALALITHKQIQTTDSKAKALKPYIDKLITAATDDNLHARRLVAEYLPNKTAVKELFTVIAPKMVGRTSGFSRIIKHRVRPGDGASISIIELLLEKERVEKGKKSSKKKGESAKHAAKSSAKAETSKKAKAEDIPAAPSADEGGAKAE